MTGQCFDTMSAKSEVTAFIFAFDHCEIEKILMRSRLDVSGTFIVGKRIHHDLVIYIDECCMFFVRYTCGCRRSMANTGKLYRYYKLLVMPSSESGVFSSPLLLKGVS